MITASGEEMNGKKRYLIFIEHLFMLTTIKMSKYTIIITIIRSDLLACEERDSEGFN